MLVLAVALELRAYRCLLDKNNDRGLCEALASPCAVGASPVSGLLSPSVEPSGTFAEHRPVVWQCPFFS